MSKKKKETKKSNNFEYMYGAGNIGRMMDRYDVRGMKSVKLDRVGVMGSDGYIQENRMPDEVDKDIAKAMMRDYDTRRSMEAAALLGNEDAKRFAERGFEGSNIYEGYNVLKDLSKEYGFGRGDKMNKPKNIAGLTNALVTADRDALTSRMEAAERAKEFEAKKPEKKEEEKEPDIQFSEQLATARGTIDAFDDFVGGGGMADMLSGDAQGAADRFRQQRAENIKQYLKPNPVSQLGAGLDMRGIFNPVIR